MISYVNKILPRLLFSLLSFINDIEIKVFIE